MSVPSLLTLARASRKLALGLLVYSLSACAGEEVPVQELLTLRNEGLLSLERGELPQAETHFARLVELAPNEPLGRANLGLTYLRAGRLAEARRELEQARRLDPRNVEVALILARTYSESGEPEQARTVLEEMRAEAEDDVRILYALAELEDPAAGGDAGRYTELLQGILQRNPTNLPVRLRLAESHLSAGRNDSTLRHLEEIRQLSPEPPLDARASLEASVAALHVGDVTAATEALEAFHAAMQVTTPYQARLAEMGWVEGPLLGRPVLSFAPDDFIALRGLREAEAAAGVSFVDATAGAGLPEPTGGPAPTTPAVIRAGDLDGDGRDELLIAGVAGSPEPRLYRARAGLFQELPPATAPDLPSSVVDALFVDIDNDGWLDLFLLEEGGAATLLQNDRSGGFQRAAAPGLGSYPDARAVAFVDVDHDGDLDLVLTGSSGTRILRNNLDGSFTDITAGFGVGGFSGTSIAFADLDDDGRTDLVLSGGEAGLIFLRNDNARGFVNSTAESGLTGGTGGATIAIADIDNDGWLDLLVGPGSDAPPALWLGRGDGTFTHSTEAASALQALGAAGGAGALLAMDFDNDGWLDLLVASAADSGAGRLQLLHNGGDGSFRDASDRLADAASAGAPVAAADVDDDGDLDILALASAGDLRLLRNDGGNLNRAVRIELRSLGQGSGKNNDFGIGSKVSFRVGDLLQTRVVTGRTTHFGLGPHLKGDVLRVEWTNGVPQNIYFPGSDQDVLELESLKGSCPFLYTWDGEKYRFVTDIMWRSALGMPVGLMGQGGEAMYAPAAASREYLRIPGDALQPRDGRYLLQLTAELWEVGYIDEVRLLAVDHPDSIDIFVDERFVPPGPVDLRVYRSIGARPPVSAVDGMGNDLLPALRDKDDVYVSNLVTTRFQGIVEDHELILDLGEEAGDPGTLLILRGWIFPTDASINVSLSQQSEIVSRAPVLDVADGNGGWIENVMNLSFPSGKNKAMVVELDGIFPSEDRRVRIRTNLQIYWDQAFVARDDQSVPVRITTLDPAEADLHYRGFSRLYRKGGRYGPHWFDYQEVSEDPAWRPIEGTYTRYGDVSELVTAPDDMYVVMAPGDEMSVAFSAGDVEDLPAGWTRDYLLYTVGWIKDSDLNTAYGNTVDPLPFHDMPEYPYGDDVSYPDTPEHQRYLREYHTRVIGRR